MPENQIQPVRQTYALAQRNRPRGVVGQVWAGLLQPGQFYRTIPPLADTRTWLWAAVLILALISISAVRQESLRNGGGDAGSGFLPSPIDPGLGGAPIPSDPFGGGGGGIGGDLFGGGGVPVDPGLGGGGGGGGSVTGTWTTALITSAGIILGWLILSILLSEITLFNGRAPRLGLNLQVAIWSSLPLALMAALQLIYFAAGGQPGAAGISGFLDDWAWYNSQPEFVRNVIFSLASNTTLFWVWSLVLIYVGGRNTLRGKHFAIALVVIAWALVIVIAPVLTGQMRAPAAPLPEALTPPLDDLGGLPGGEFPGFDVTPGAEGAIPGFELPLDVTPGAELPADLIDVTPEAGVEIPIDAIPTVPNTP
jgi:hypothetical protein